MRASSGRFAPSLDELRPRVRLVSRPEWIGAKDGTLWVCGCGLENSGKSSSDFGPPPPYPQVAEWTPKQKLALEKESLGFYISGHPMDRYSPEIQRARAARVAQVLGEEESSIPTPSPRERPDVTVGGVVSDFRERPLKSGTGRMASFRLEDTSGGIEVVCSLIIILSYLGSPTTYDDYRIIPGQVADIDLQKYSRVDQIHDLSFRYLGKLFARRLELDVRYGYHHQRVTDQDRSRRHEPWQLFVPRELALCIHRQQLRLLRDHKHPPVGQ